MKKLYAILVSCFCVFIFATTINVFANSNSEIFERWEAYGILEPIEDKGLNDFITYNEFNAITNLLFSRSIDEKYTFIAGEMFIRRFEAYSMFAQFMGIEPGGSRLFADDALIPMVVKDYITALSNEGLFRGINYFRPTEFLTKNELIHLIDGLIAVFINEIGRNNFEGRTINGNILINVPFSKDINENNVVLVERLNARNIVVAGYAPNVELISVRGNLVLSHPSSNTEITLRASEFNAIVTESNTSLIIINSRTGLINLFADGLVDGRETGARNPININIHSDLVYLVGDFNNIAVHQRNLDLRLFGSIRTLNAYANTFVSGSPVVHNFVAVNGIRIEYTVSALQTMQAEFFINLFTAILDGRPIQTITELPGAPFTSGGGSNNNQELFTPPPTPPPSGGGGNNNQQQPPTNPPNAITSISFALPTGADGFISTNDFEGSVERTVVGGNVTVSIILTPRNNRVFSRNITERDINILTDRRFSIEYLSVSDLGDRLRLGISYSTLP